MSRHRPLKRLAGRIIVSSLLCLGFWQFGQGAYIPAKAWVAQELMQRAWRKAGDGHGQPAPWLWPYGSMLGTCSLPRDSLAGRTGVLSIATRLVNLLTR